MTTIHEDHEEKMNKSRNKSVKDYKKKYEQAEHIIKKLRNELAAVKSANGSTVTATAAAGTQAVTTRDNHAQTEEDEAKSELQQELERKCNEVAVLKQQLRRMVENIQSFTSSIVLDVDKTTACENSPLSPAPVPPTPTHTSVSPMPTPAALTDTPISPDCGTPKVVLPVSSACVNLSLSFEASCASLTRNEVKNVTHSVINEPIENDSEDKSKEFVLNEMLSGSNINPTLSGISKDKTHSKSTKLFAYTNINQNLDVSDSACLQTNSDQKSTINESSLKPVDQANLSTLDVNRESHDLPETLNRTSSQEIPFNKHSFLEEDETDTTGFSPHFSSTESDFLEAHLDKNHQKENVLTSYSQNSTSESPTLGFKKKNDISKPVLEPVIDTHLDNIQFAETCKRDFTSEKYISKDLKSNSKLTEIEHSNQQNEQELKDMPENVTDMCQSNGHERNKKTEDLDGTNTFSKHVKAKTHRKIERMRSKKSSGAKLNKLDTHKDTKGVKTSICISDVAEEVDTHKNIEGVNTVICTSDVAEEVDTHKDNEGVKTSICTSDVAEEVDTHKNNEGVNTVLCTNNVAEELDTHKDIEGVKTAICTSDIAEGHHIATVDHVQRKPDNLGLIDNSKLTTGRPFVERQNIKDQINDKFARKSQETISKEGFGTEQSYSKPDCSISTQSSVERVNMTDELPRVAPENTPNPVSEVCDRNSNITIEKEQLDAQVKLHEIEETPHCKELSNKMEVNEQYIVSSNTDFDSKSVSGTFQAENSLKEKRFKRKRSTDDVKELKAKKSRNDSASSYKGKTDTSAKVISDVVKTKVDVEKIQTERKNDERGNRKKSKSPLTKANPSASTEPTSKQRSQIKELETETTTFGRRRKDTARSVALENDHSKTIKPFPKEKVNEATTKTKGQSRPEGTEEEQHREILNSLSDYCTKFRQKCVNRNYKGLGTKHPCVEETVAVAVKQYTQIARNACTRSRISLQDYRQKRNCILKDKASGVYMSNIENAMAKSACLSTINVGDHCERMTFGFSNKLTTDNKGEQFPSKTIPSDTRRLTDTEGKEYIIPLEQEMDDNQKETFINENQKTRLDFSAIEAGLSCFASKIAGSAVVVPKRVERIKRTPSPTTKVQSTDLALEHSSVSNIMSLIKDNTNTPNESNTAAKFAGADPGLNDNSSKAIDRTQNKLDTLQWASDKTASYLSDLYSMATKEDESAVNLVVSNTINVLTDVHNELSKSSPRKVRPPFRLGLQFGGADRRPAIFEQDLPNSEAVDSLAVDSPHNVTNDISEKSSLAEAQRKSINSFPDAELEVEKFSTKFGQPFRIPKKPANDANLCQSSGLSASSLGFVPKLDPSFKIPKKPKGSTFSVGNVRKTCGKGSNKSLIPIGQNRPPILVPLERKPGTQLDDPRLEATPLNQPETAVLVGDVGQSVSVVQSRDPRRRQRWLAAQKDAPSNIPCASPQKTSQQNQDLNVVLDLLRTSEKKNETETLPSQSFDPNNANTGPPQNVSNIPPSESNIQQLAMMMQLLTDPKFYPDSPFINTGPSPELAQRAMFMLSQGFRPDLMQHEAATSQDVANTKPPPDHPSLLSSMADETAADKNECNETALSPSCGAVRDASPSLIASPLKNAPVKTRRCLKREVKDPSSYKSSRVHVDTPLPVDSLSSDTQDSTLWNMAMNENDVSNELRSPNRTSIGSRRSSLGTQDDSFLYDDIPHTSFDGSDNMPKFVNFIENLDFSSFFGKSKEGQKSIGSESSIKECTSSIAGGSKEHESYACDNSEVLEDKSKNGSHIELDKLQDLQVEQTDRAISHEVKKPAKYGLSAKNISCDMDTDTKKSQESRDNSVMLATDPSEVLSLSKEQETSYKEPHPNEHNISEMENKPAVITDAKETSNSKENDVEKLDKEMPNPQISLYNITKDESTCDLGKDLYISDDGESSCNITPSASNTNLSEITRCNKTPNAIGSPVIGERLSKFVDSSNSKDSLVMHSTPSCNVKLTTYDEQHSNFLVCFSASTSNQLTISDEEEDQSSFNLSKSIEDVDIAKSSVTEESFERSTNSLKTPREKESSYFSTFKNEISACLSGSITDVAEHIEKDTPQNILEEKSNKLNKKTSVPGDESAQMGDVTEKNTPPPSEKHADCELRDNLKVSPLKRFKSRLSPKVLQSAMYSPVRQAEDGTELKLPGDEDRSGEASCSETSGCDDPDDDTGLVVVENTVQTTLTRTSSTPKGSATNESIQNQVEEHEIDSISLLPAGEDTFDCHDVSNPFSPDTNKKTKSVSPDPAKRTASKSDQSKRDVRKKQSSTSGMKQSSKASSDSRRDIDRQAYRRERKGSKDDGNRINRSSQRLDVRSSPRKRVDSTDSPRSHTRELLKRSDSNRDGSRDRPQHDIRSTRNKRCRDSKWKSSDFSRSNDSLRQTRASLQSRRESQKSGIADTKGSVKSRRSQRHSGSNSRRSGKHTKEKSETKDCPIKVDTESPIDDLNDSDIETSIDLSEFIEVDNIEGSDKEEQATDIDESKDQVVETENHPENREGINEQDFDHSFEEKEEASDVKKGDNLKNSKEAIKENKDMMEGEGITETKETEESNGEVVASEEVNEEIEGSVKCERPKVGLVKLNEETNEKVNKQRQDSIYKYLIFPNLQKEKCELVDIDISLEEGELSDSVDDETAECALQKESKGTVDGATNERIQHNKNEDKDRPKQQGSKGVDLREKLRSKRVKADFGKTGDTRKRTDHDRHERSPQRLSSPSSRDRRENTRDALRDRSPRSHERRPGEYARDRSPRYSDQRSSNSRERVSPRRVLRDARREVRSPPRRGDDYSQRDRDRGRDSTLDTRRDRRSPNRRRVDSIDRKARSVSRERQRNKRSSSVEKYRRNSPGDSDKERNTRSTSRERRAKIDTRTPKASRYEPRSDAKSGTLHRKSRTDSRVNAEGGSGKETRSSERHKESETSKPTNRDSKPRAKRKRAPSNESSKPRKGKR